MDRSHLLLSLLVSSGLCSAQSAAPACLSPEARQFDFWLGEWELTGRHRLQPDVTQWQETRSTNSIRSVLDGCVTLETFQNLGPTAWSGMSVSTWNPQSHRWNQTWVDSQGSYITLSGEFADGRMVLVTPPRASNAALMNRMVYHDIAADSLIWSWELSHDGGRSWAPMWEITYRRKK